MAPKRKPPRKEEIEESSSDPEVAETIAAKPKRGRPPKSAAQAKPEQAIEPQVKRPRGRPKGSGKKQGSPSKTATNGQAAPQEAAQQQQPEAAEAAEPAPKKKTRRKPIAPKQAN
ncbi:hypothetical protein WJX74_002953 [Apatococcus lobatus]|uniref:Uncharacterized protein n=1 Tax=Apatococcus lobatus TaxID=904363 RepID=A0AAW1QU20_9CHLO